MLTLKIKNPFKKTLPDPIQVKTLKEKVILLITRDLMRLGWTYQIKNDRIEISPPKYYNKEIIKQSMGIKRDEIIYSNKEWIDKHIHIARSNLADGDNVLNSKIKPIIEVCETRQQLDLFRIFRYYWSSPYSEYVGRRIKLIIRDAALPGKPVMGIAALGSPIIHIPERDNFIGWNKEIRTKNLNYMMDAYVIGAMPPYNYLLGGKLISYILTSNEVREIFNKKYRNTKYNQLAGIFTTSLYGKSSQYNRLVYKNRLVYTPIGETKGFGTLHLTNETFNTMNSFLKDSGIVVSNNFGDGPSWSMRVIRHAGLLLGFDPDHLLMHSFKRKIYYVPFAKNTLNFLNDKDDTLIYYNQSINNLTNYWKQRWYNQRKSNSDIIDKVLNFKKEDFQI